MAVLLIEDEPELSNRLKSALTQSGFIVDAVHDGETGLEYAQSVEYEAIVLDLGLPKMPGLEVLKRLRAAGGKAPVLILTARNSWTDRVEGLNLGADDYLGKPFQAPEVIARVRALVRRSLAQPNPVLQAGGITLDTSAAEAAFEGKTVQLTAFELRLLTYLMQRAGRIVAQADIIDHVYNMSDARESNTVEVYVARLRKKLGRDSIQTIRGLGYRIAP